MTKDEIKQKMNDWSMGTPVVPREDYTSISSKPMSMAPRGYPNPLQWSDPPTSNWQPILPSSPTIIGPALPPDQQTPDYIKPAIWQPIAPSPYPYGSQPRQGDLSARPEEDSPLDTQLELLRQFAKQQEAYALATNDKRAREARAMQLFATARSPVKSSSTKTAWSSADLRERQSDIATYSEEIAQLFEMLVQVMNKRIPGRDFAPADMEFIVNFGAPAVDNTKNIVVKTTAPQALTINLMQQLTDKGVTWDVSVYEDGVVRPDETPADTLQLGRGRVASPAVPAGKKDSLVINEREIEL